MPAVSHTFIIGGARPKNGEVRPPPGNSRLPPPSCKTQVSVRTLHATHLPQLPPVLEEGKELGSYFLRQTAFFAGST